MVQSSYRQYYPVCCELFRLNILKLNIALYHELTLEQKLNSYMIYPVQSALVSCSVCTQPRFQTDRKRPQPMLSDWSSHIYFLIKIKGSTSNKPLRFKNKLQLFHQSSWTSSFLWFSFSVGCPWHPTIPWRFNNILYRWATVQERTL